MLAARLGSVSEVFARLTEALEPDQQIYLVGGAVRDLLLGRSLHDFDFAVWPSARQIARRIANRLGGHFFVMDAEHDVARVIWKPVQGERQIFDFSRLRSADIETDLHSRDFTINAIAIDLRDPDNLVDPLGGAVDLKNGVLRACSSDAFREDPIRVLRAVRLAIAFNLKIEPQTLAQLRQAVSLLANASSERQRDELFRMFDAPKTGSALRILDQFGALDVVLPELGSLKGVEQTKPHTQPVWEHTLAAVTAFEPLYSHLVGSYDEEAADLMTGLAVMQLGRFRFALAEHFNNGLNPERSHKSLLKFALLYHDIGKPETQTRAADGRLRFINHDPVGARIAAERAEALALSRAEVERVETIVRHHMRIHLLVQTGQPPSRRAQYRFYRDTGPAGVDICLLTLADTMGTYGATLPVDVWNAELSVVRTMLESWFERPTEVVSPPRLINGDDLQLIFDLQPGPVIGDVLEAVRERQAEGKLHDRQAAIDFARNWLKNRGMINGGKENE